MWRSRLLEECCTTTRVSKVKVEEKGKKATFLNPKKEVFTKVRFDGCQVQNKRGCDWIVIHSDTDNILVEL